MAVSTSTSLRLTMTSMNGSKNVTFKYADPDATVEKVKTLAQALVDNTAIFAETYTGLSAAKLITTETQDLSL